jgi:PKD repeat protein
MKRSWWTMAMTAALGVAVQAAAVRADDGSVIDVLMLYTPEVRANAGGTGAIETTLNNAIAEVNAALNNSNVGFQYRIVHMAEVDYPNPTVDPKLAEYVLRNLRETDGVLDQVLTMRNTYGADMVHMILESSDFNAGCGSGYLRRASDSAAEAATWAFSITHASCISYVGSRYQVGHALGHNFGLQHYPGFEHEDGRKDANGNPLSPMPIAPYGYGYIDPQNRFCDIMAGDCPQPGPNATGDYNCPRVQRYSNITTTYNGAPIGNASNGDAARVMNELRVSVSNYRSSTATPTPTPTPPSGSVPVTWTNAVQVTATAGSLTRSNTAAGWTAGAVSVQQAFSGNTAVEFTANETNTYRLLGLSNGDSGQNYTDIDFAIYPAADGVVYVFEAGVFRGAFGTYQAGDRLAVEVLSGTVRYKKNGTVLFTNSSPSILYPLRVDTALYTPGATLAGVVVFGMSSGANVPPTASAGGSYRWTAGQAMTLDGSGSSDSDGSIVSYAWSFGDGSTGSSATASHTYSSPGSYTAALTVTDNSGATGTSSASVTITAAVSTSSVTWQNTAGVSASAGSLQKTAADGWDAGASSVQTLASGDGYVQTTVGETNTYRLVGLSNGDSTRSYDDVDFAIFPGGNGSIYVFEGGVSRGTFGAYAAGDRLRVSVDGGTVRYLRNGRLLYTSTVAPVYPLLVDTSLYNAGATLGGVVVTGAAANTPPVARPGGPYEWSAGQAIQFDGTASSDNGGSIVSYNWAFGDSTTGTGATPQHAYASAGTYTATLVVTDNSGSTHSASTTVVVDARSTTPVTWTAMAGVSVSGSTISKPGAAGWDAGAISSQSIASAGFVQATVTETSTYRLVGLGTMDNSRSYEDVDFGIYPAGNGQLYAFESGVNAGTLGTYATGDRLRVSVSSGPMGPMVTYIKNGRVLLMTHPAITYPLRVDTSFYSTGASLSGVVLTTP